MGENSPMSGGWLMGESSPMSGGLNMDESTMSGELLMGGLLNGENNQKCGECMRGEMSTLEMNVGLCMMGDYMKGGFNKRNDECTMGCELRCGDYNKKVACMSCDVNKKEEHMMCGDSLMG